MSKAMTPVDTLRASVGALKEQFEMALPKHVPVEKFMRIIQTAIVTTPALAKADRSSFLGACMKAAATGLLPDGKEAAIVTFGDKCAYMPMISGILKLVRNSGELLSITSQIVYERDEFKYHIDSEGEHLEHKPNMFSDRGKKIGCYALAKTKDGGFYIEVMTQGQINAVKKVSRSANNGPWSGDFEDEMWKKTVLRRLSKRLPLSTDIDQALHADDDLYDLPKKQTAPTQEVPEALPKEEPKRKSRLEKVVESDVMTEAEPEQNLPI